MFVCVYVCVCVCVCVCVYVCVIAWKDIGAGALITCVLISIGSEQLILVPVVYPIISAALVISKL